MIATTFLEMLGLMFAALSVVGLCLGIYVWVSLRWERWQRRRKDTGVYPMAFLEAGFDFCVDGQPYARLTWAGPPPDLNHLFTLYDVFPREGREADVEKLLYETKKRHLADARISYRSLDPTIADFHDSQVLIGYLGGNRIELKIYFDDHASNVA